MGGGPGGRDSVARECYDKAAKERQRQGQEHGRKSQQGATVENLPQSETGRSRDQAAKAVGVSGRTVDFATKVLKQGQPELVKAMIAAEMLPMLEKEAKERQREHAGTAPGRPAKSLVANSPQVISDRKPRNPTSRDIAAKLVGVGARCVQDAKPIKAGS